jgi:hypothetical protein
MINGLRWVITYQTLKQWESVSFKAVNWMIVFTLLEYLSSSSVFCGILVTQSLVFCVLLCRPLLSFCPFFAWSLHRSSICELRHPITIGLFKFFIQLHKSFSSLKPLKLSCTYVSESMCIIQIMLLINRTHIVQLDITIESHVNLILTDETDTACEIMSVSLGQTVKEHDWLMIDYRWIDSTCNNLFNKSNLIWSID